MPFSDPTAHPILRDAIAERAAPGDTFLDCGVGCGITGRIIREACDGATITGLEVYAPYVTSDKLRIMQRDQWGLYHELYDSMVLGPEGEMCTWLDGTRSQQHDFVIFGDSLEHVTEAEAEEALADARAIARKAVLVTTPLKYLRDGVWYWVGQTEAFGNAHEAHLKHWQRHELEALGLTFLGSGEKASVFVWDRGD